MELSELQEQMELTYGPRDRARGIPATVAWLAEELGELAQAARKGTRAEQAHELGDVLAWVGLPGQPARDLPRPDRRPVPSGVPPLWRTAVHLPRSLRSLAFWGGSQERLIGLTAASRSLGTGSPGRVPGEEHR